MDERRNVKAKCTVASLKEAEKVTKERMLRLAAGGKVTPALMIAVAVYDETERALRVARERRTTLIREGGLL